MTDSDDTESDAPQQRDEGAYRIQDFIFSRELAEVYLLLDNVAMAQGKDLPDLDKDPLFAAEAKDTPGVNGAPDTPGKSWIEQICEIGWPPSGTIEQQAHKAAKLIRAREELNSKAYPASGYTVAFTSMVSGESRDPKSGAAAEARGWLPSWFGSPPTPPDYGSIAQTGWGGKPPSRESLARIAFPSLWRRTGRYRWIQTLIVLFMVAWLVLTCLLSWDLASGNALLNRVTTLDASRVEIEKLIASAEDTRNVKPTPPGTGVQQGGAATPVAPSGAAPADDYRFCVDLKKPGISNSEIRLCQRRDQNIAQYNEAAANLRSWQGKSFFPRRLLCYLTCRLGLGWDDERAATPGPGAAASSYDAASYDAAKLEVPAIVLGVLGGVVLPIFYGVLGAGAAVVRGLSAKVRDSQLSPRDLDLAPVQLALGAVIGGCIGLFVDPGGAAATTTDPGLIGAVHLSASALCFVAGFGVEGVFLALEALIRRVFNLPK